MALRVEVPFPPVQPTSDVLEFVAPHEPGQILDSGLVQSEWSTGEIVLTAYGIVVCDVDRDEIIGVRWSDISNQPESVVEPDSQVSISLGTGEESSIDLVLSGRLVSNMSALSHQLADIDLVDDAAAIEVVSLADDARVSWG